MGRSYKDSIYKGYQITFNVEGRMVYARVPAITRQYLGIAHNKTDALEEAQEAIDRYIRNQKKRTALSNNNRRR